MITLFARIEQLETLCYESMELIKNLPGKTEKLLLVAMLGAVASY